MNKYIYFLLVRSDIWRINVGCDFLIIKYFNTLFNKDEINYNQAT